MDCLDIYFTVHFIRNKHDIALISVTYSCLYYNTSSINLSLLFNKILFFLTHQNVFSSTYSFLFLLDGGCTLFLSMKDSFSFFLFTSYQLVCIDELFYNHSVSNTRNNNRHEIARSTRNYMKPITAAKIARITFYYVLISLANNNHLRILSRRTQHVYVHCLNSWNYRLWYFCI